MVQSVGFKSVVVTVVNAGTPVQIASAISGGNVMPYRFEMHVPNGNSGASAFIGNASVSSADIPRAKATAAGNPDGTYLFIASENAALSKGEHFDFRKLFIDVATNGDTVIIQYLVSES